ncbi:hypothetical protein F5148DRAFT_1284497 [Russula earlei]|uniref:Uncharacterized protein n=1 Tax=Russula earlei TaxID=71964 RepID=A0ACC0UAD6_9AGAM|nr:hypothetical protein F5148DRAFT_1284497 [Russula earlei]
MSSTLKPSFDPKRTHQQKIPDQYRTQIPQLQELFPAWTIDDLLSTLIEAGGDVSLAATRISDGRTEQWVTRKKDKKASPHQGPTKDSSSTRDTQSRGARGGRGGRGGPGRGGAVGGRALGARGGHRDSHRNHSHPHGGAPASPAANGDAPLSTDSWGDTTAGASADTYAGWANTTSETQAGAWGTNTESTWGAPSTANGSAAASPSVKTQPILPTRPNVKTPATSKLSWAQIARAPEKPLTAAASNISQPVPPLPLPSAPLEPPREPTPPPAPTQDDELSSEAQSGWEEPTTAKSPPWEDEPQPKPPASAAESWDATPAEESKVFDQATPPSPEPAPAPEPVPAPIAVSLPAPEPVVGLGEAIPKHVTPVQARPSSAAHRHSARFKTDQAVTLPNNFGPGLEKVGMQFGSLSIGGDEIVDPKPEPVSPSAPEPVAKLSSESPAAPESQQLPSAPPPPQPELPVTSSSITPSLNSAPSFTQSTQPQTIPQQAQASVPSQPASAHLQTSVSQPALTSPSAVPQVSSQISGYPHQSQQQPLQPPPPPPPPSQQQQVSPPSHQQPPHHSLQQQYAQHGLPTHLDPAQAQHQSPPPQQQVPTSFYRQPDAQGPYFHAGAGTPPTSQAQDSPYTAFGQLNQQGPVSQLGAFGGGADYGYGDSQQQTGAFGARGGLHDDVKGLPGLQQQHSSSSSSNSSSNSNNSPNNSSKGDLHPLQAARSRADRAIRPPWVTTSHILKIQFYGSPYNYAYSVPQPFVKYPVFPPGPGSAPSPAGPPGKQPQSYGQGQGQSLYGQQHQQAYDEPQLGYHPHANHSHQLSASLGGVLPADYGKALYAHQQGLSTRGAAASPETAFKPYAQGAGTKDVGGVGSGTSGGPQSRGGAPAQAGGFYGAAAGRFAGPGAQAQTGGPGQTQQAQGGPQGHLGYPQGASEGAFYSAYGPAAAQQGRQGYWQ